MAGTTKHFLLLQDGGYLLYQDDGRIIIDDAHYFVLKFVLKETLSQSYTLQTNLKQSQSQTHILKTTIVTRQTKSFVMQSVIIEPVLIIDTDYLVGCYDLTVDLEGSSD